jgi:hypothetical protein
MTILLISKQGFATEGNDGEAGISGRKLAVGMLDNNSSFYLGTTSASPFRGPLKLKLITA